MTAVKHKITSRLMPLEVGLAIVSLLFLFYWGYRGGGNEMVSALLEEKRAMLYGTLASISATMLGFTLTATALCLNLTSKERFAELRSKRAFPKLWEYFLWAIAVLTVDVLICLAAFTVDRNDAPVIWMSYIVVFVSLLSLCFLLNVIYALKLIVGVATQPDEGSPSGRQDRESIANPDQLS